MKSWYHDWGKPHIQRYEIRIRGAKSTEYKSFSVYTSEPMSEVVSTVKSLLFNCDKIRRKDLLDLYKLKNDHRSCYIFQFDSPGVYSKRQYLRFRSLQNPNQIVKILKSYLHGGRKNETSTKQD